MEIEIYEQPPKTFADYQADGHLWITLATGDYYPDILVAACQLYEPVLVTFRQLIESSESSVRLLSQILATQETWMRIQLLRVFKKYVSPGLPVEMSKVKRRTETIIAQFGAEFRPIQLVYAKFKERPIPDEALCVLLWEYKDRGKKGYNLTERFFELFASTHPTLSVKGPRRAGRDIFMGEVFADYPNSTRPVDL